MLELDRTNGNGGGGGGLLWRTYNCTYLGAHDDREAVVGAALEHGRDPAHVLARTQRDDGARHHVARGHAGERRAGRRRVLDVRDALELEVEVVDADRVPASREEYRQRRGAIACQRTSSSGERSRRAAAAGGETRE